MSIARPSLFSREEIHRAWLDCRRRKRGTPGAVAFEMRLADELASLEEELTFRTYRPRPCVRFATRRPKLREIVAAEFRDRVVHHLFVRAVEPDWERVFIHDSFACRKGKGTHAAVDRLERFVRTATGGGQRPAFFLQLDIRSFFMSIDRAILFARIDRRLRLRSGLDPGPDLVGPFREKSAQQVLALPRRAVSVENLDAYDALRWLACTLIFHDPIDGCITRGDRSLIERVPMHKTLAGSGPGRGLPIGNLTSQFFANVYLDALDQFVKHALSARFYIRYVDDFVLIHERREVLEMWREEIGNYLGRVLNLAFNPSRERLRPVSSGIDFLGYIVHPDHRLVRRRVLGSLRERIVRAENALIRKRPDGGTLLRYPEAEMARLEAGLNSYLAHFAKADAFRLTASLWRRYSLLGAFVGREGNKAVRRDRPRRFKVGFRRQHAWFARRAGGGVLFFQVGSHFELLNGQARDFGPRLGLRQIVNRPGFWRRCGFHRRYLARYIEKAADAGLSVTIVRETGRRTEKTRERRVVARILVAKQARPERM